MTIFKPGKLYRIHEEFYWLVFPTLEMVWRVLLRPEHTGNEALNQASFYRQRLKCHVQILEPEDIFCCLEQHGAAIKLLSANGEVGWIYFPPENAWKDSITELI
jgi:hypothetical protein